MRFKVLISLIYAHIYKLLVLCVLATLITARFFWLDYSPPGFFVDEAGAAAHVVCLKELGTNCRGESLTLYSTTWGVGRIGPVYQYSGWLWAEIFGSSIFSLRAMTAFFGLLAIFMLYQLALSIAGKNVAAWTAFSALLLPWGFHGSRLSWDPPLAPVFVVACIYFVYQVSIREDYFIPLVLAAVAAVLSGLTYPPVLAHTFFLLLFLFLFQKWIIRLPFKRWFILGFLCTAFLAPVQFADTSAVKGRALSVGIFGNDSRNPTAGQAWYMRGPQFVKNVSKHFSIEYLFTKGEFNLRHTVQGYGIMSWLDSFALAASVLVFMLGLIVKKFRLPDDDASSIRVLVIIGFLGYLSSTMAASLTWDSLPHGLRSLSGWPFIALLSGACLAYINRFFVFHLASLVVAGFFIYHFSFYYFNTFRKSSTWWFDTDVTDALASNLANGGFVGFKKFMEKRQYPSHARRYYYTAYFNDPVKK